MKKISSKNKRKLRNRKKLKTVSFNRYRVCISKSLNNLSAQIIDDKQKKTLVSASSMEKNLFQFGVIISHYPPAPKSWNSFRHPALDRR